MSEDLRAELEKYLEALNIQTSCVEHPPVKPETPVRLVHLIISLFVNRTPTACEPGPLGSVCAVLTVKFELRVLGRPAAPCPEIYAPVQLRDGASLPSWICVYDPDGLGRDAGSGFRESGTSWRRFTGLFCTFMTCLDPDGTSLFPAVQVSAAGTGCDQQGAAQDRLFHMSSNQL